MGNALRETSVLGNTDKPYPGTYLEMVRNGEKEMEKPMGKVS